MSFSSFFISPFWPWLYALHCVIEWVKEYNIAGKLPEDSHRETRQMHIGIETEEEEIEIDQNFSVFPVPKSVINI